MKYRVSILVVTKEIVKKFLKSSSVCRFVYPLMRSVYRWYALPMKRRRLQHYGSGVLQRIEGVLNANNITHYMDYGTLLGFIRDNGFIKHDDDVDITIFPGTNNPKFVLERLLAEGYGFIHAFEYEGKIIEFTVADETQVTIDIFFPRRSEKDPRVFDFILPDWSPNHKYPSENANDAILTPYVGANELVAYEVVGVNVTIPSNAEEVLESEYGPWKVPDPNFRCEEDERVIRLPGFVYRLSKEEALVHVGCHSG